MHHRRFTDTNLWGRAWFHDLPLEFKIHFFYIKDKVNAAGVWEIVPHEFQFHTGTPLRLKEFVAALNGTGELVQTDDEKRVEILTGGKHLWLVKFCVFQYPSGLRENDNSHKGVFKELRRWNLLQRVLEMYQQRGTEPTGEVLRLADVPTNHHFEEWWEKYPLKVGKIKAIKSWNKEVGTKAESLLPKMLAALDWQAKQKKWIDKQYVPHPASYLNGRRWEDEPPKSGGGEARHKDGF